MAERSDYRPKGPIQPRDHLPTEVIGSQRRQVTCVSCGGPRDPSEHPVCDGCSRRRREGLR